MPLKLETDPLLEQGAARRAGDLQLSPLCHMSLPSCQSPAWPGFPPLKNWSGKRKGPWAAVPLLEALREEVSLDLLPSELSMWQMWREARGPWALQALRRFSS